MEEDLRSLAKEVAEAEIIVDQRVESHEVVDKKITELKAELKKFHRSKTDLINNRYLTRSRALFQTPPPLSGRSSCC